MTAGDETGREPVPGTTAAVRRLEEEFNTAHDDRLYEIWLTSHEEDVYAFGYRYSADRMPVLLEVLMSVVQDDGARPRDRALGDLGDPRAVPALIDALADQGGVPGGNARVYVYYDMDQPVGFRRVPWRRCCELVRGIRLGDASLAAEMAAAIAAESLGEIGSEQAVPALINVLQDGSRDISTRYVAAMALGQIGEPSALPALRSIQGDRNERRGFREAMSTCISHIESRMKTPEQLVSDLGSDDAAVVCFAIDRLVRLGEETAVPALAKSYDDPRMFMFPGRPHTRYTIRYLAREAVRDIRARHAGLGVGALSADGG